MANQRVTMSVMLVCHSRLGNCQLCVCDGACPRERERERERVRWCV